MTRGSGGSAINSLAGYQGQCGDADSDSFQGPRQPGNRSSVLLVLGKRACIHCRDVSCPPKVFCVTIPGRMHV